MLVLLSACVDYDYLPPDKGGNLNGNGDSTTEQEIGQPTGPATTWQEQYIQALVNVNIRLTPNATENNIIGLLKTGEVVQLLHRESINWYYIIYKGQEAYISANASYTRLLSNPDYNLDSERDVKIEAIIAAGKTKLGIPYEYGASRILLYGGGINPNFTGKTFDCSSFVQYAFYIGAGIKLQGDSRNQSLHGESIARADLQNGDLIFMTTPSRANIKGIEHIGHVAIYLGEGKILHTHGVGGVKVDNFSGVWSTRYVCAKRMF